MDRLCLYLTIFCFIFCSCETKENLNLKPKVKSQKEALGHFGSGWSQNKNPKLATKEALAMAMKTNKGKVNFAMFFASSGSDLKSIAQETRKILGSKAKIFGMTSDSRAVICDKKYVRAEKKDIKLHLMELEVW